ncbi:MAG: cytochrome c5 [Pseudohongiellaceae bacterium]
MNYKAKDSLHFKKGSSHVSNSRSAVFTAIAVLSLTWLQVAQAQSVADNIRPVAKVCLAGQPCVGSASGAAQAAAPKIATTTLAAPAAAVAAAAEEVVEEVVEMVAQVAAVDSGFDAAAKYQQSCFACHGTGAAGAPKLDDKVAWENIMAKGMDAVMVNVMNGINVMPAKGLCFDCSQDDLMAIVAYMSSQ